VGVSMRGNGVGIRGAVDLLYRSRTMSQGNVQQPPLKKPGFVTAIGGMRLGAGCINILIGLSLFWLFYPLLLIPLGIIEIINGAGLLSAQPKAVKWLKGLAILEIIAIVAFSVASLIVGILTLVFLSREEVKKYFADLGFPY
jgi:hypothetical protein